MQRTNSVVKTVSVTRKAAVERLSVRVLRCVDVESLLRELSGYESIKILSETVIGCFKICEVDCHGCSNVAGNH